MFFVIIVESLIGLGEFKLSKWDDIILFKLRLSSSLHWSEGPSSAAGLHLGQGLLMEVSSLAAGREVTLDLVENICQTMIRLYGFKNMLFKSIATTFF